MGMLVSILLGYGPMFLFAGIIYWLDRFEKEPKHLLGGVFLWGAVVAAGAAFFLNTVLGIGVYLFTQSEAAASLATGTLIAPLVEEVFKGLAVLAIFLLFREEFDSLLDGVVYAAITAIGFAATENVYYIYNFGYLQNGYAGLFWLAFLRLVLVGWQHPFYSAFFGIGLALARWSKRPVLQIGAPLSGLALAAGLHALHNTFSSMIQNYVGLALGAVFDWSGWTLMLLFIFWATERERRWIVENLMEEAQQGMISPGQYQRACSAWGRSLARLKGLIARRFRTTSRFYQVCSELAYKKEQLRHLGEEARNSQIVADLRQELTYLASLVGD